MNPPGEHPDRLVLAGRAEEGIGDPTVVAAALAALAADLIAAMS